LAIYHPPPLRGRYMAKTVNSLVLVCYPIRKDVISLGYRAAVGKVITVGSGDHYERETNIFHIQDPYVSCSGLAVPISALSPKCFCLGGFGVVVYSADWQSIARRLVTETWARIPSVVYIYVPYRFYNCKFRI
jgi:hypothetical protein